MRRTHPRSSLLVCFVLFLAACGGSGGSTDPDGNPNNGNAGGGKTLTGTYNGATFTPNLLTSAYLSGQVGVHAADGTHNLAINATNVTARGTYSVAAGNSNSAIAQWIDNTGVYSSLYSGGAGGTVTFTILQLGRVAGSFNFTARTGPSASAQSMAVIGTFDIKFP